MLEFVPFNKIDSGQWDDFCLISDDAWFRHSSAGIKFCLGADSLNENLSFGIFENNKLLAVMAIVKQLIAGEKDLYEFAMTGTPTPGPAFNNELSEKQKNKILAAIFKEVDKIARDRNVAYSKFFIDPLSAGFLDKPNNYNPFLKLGCNDISLTTNIVDLSLTEEELFKKIRDTYQDEIKSAAGSGLSVIFFDENNIDAKVFEIYKNIYFSAAGREVGNVSRWNATFQLIKQGNAVLALEKNKDGESVGGVIFFTYKNNAHYASGATIPDFKKKRGIGHLSQWEIIKYLKVHNFGHYELGWNFYPVISDKVHSQKEINISLFKSGFGGKVLPLFRGEKFFSAEYLRKKKAALTDKYIGSYL